MPVASYGTTNYRGLDPTPIESVLAPLAVAGNKAEAQNMLDYYQIQRETAGNAYGADLQQQHDYAYQQLANQMYEAKLKAGPEYLKSGGAALLGRGGIPGMDMGADPGVMQNVINQSNAAEQAKTFQASMTGLNQGSQGGYQVAGGMVPGLSPNISLTNKGPALEQAAQTRAGATLGAAAIGAAGKGQPSASIMVRDPNTGLPVTLRIPRANPASVGAAANQWGVPNVDQPPPNAPIPGGGMIPNMPPGPGSQNTSAPPAPSPGGGGGTPQNEASGNAALQAQVKASLNNPGSVSPQAKADILAAAAKNGGNPVVGTDAQGKPYAVGASGQKYR